MFCAKPFYGRNSLFFDPIDWQLLPLIFVLTQWVLAEYWRKSHKHGFFLPEPNLNLSDLFWNLVVCTAVWIWQEVKHLVCTKSTFLLPHLGENWHHTKPWPHTHSLTSEPDMYEVHPPSSERNQYEVIKPGLSITGVRRLQVYLYTCVRLTNVKQLSAP